MTSRTYFTFIDRPKPLVFVATDAKTRRQLRREGWERLRVAEADPRFRRWMQALPANGLAHEFPGYDTPTDHAHYHVGNGNPGCLFDSISGPFTNRRDAEAYASRESRDNKANHDQWAGDDEPKMKRFILRDVQGRPAIYVCERAPYGVQYLWEVYPCNEPMANCQEAAEW